MCALFNWFFSIDWKPDAVTAAATVFLAILTAILAFGSVILYCATRRLVIGAEQTSERQLRAYVMIDMANIDRIAIGVSPRALIKLKNFGKTPAYKIRQRAIIKIMNPNILPTLPTERDDMSETALGPGGEMIIPPMMDKPLQASDITELQNGTKILYVIGEIRYVDAFGQNRCTNYSMFSTDGKGTLAAHTEGNKAT